jgi:hypothetical protein
MGSLRQRLVLLGGDAAPRGRLRWLQMRTSAEVLMTIALGLAALAMSVGYQVLVHRRPGATLFRR